MKKLMVLMTASIALAASQTQALDAEAKFKTSCAACHAPQTAAMLGAPAAFDAAAWAPRMEKGMDTLVKHVTEGFNAMPPRGLCGDCSADDYKALITYMSTAQ